jgi:hypothetical protein
MHAFQVLIGYQHSHQNHARSKPLKLLTNLSLVRSNTFVNNPWQLREFKTDIDADGKVVFVADSVKSNPLAELFAKEGNLDSDSLKALRVFCSLAS